MKKLIFISIFFIVVFIVLLIWKNKTQKNIGKNVELNQTSVPQNKSLNKNDKQYEVILKNLDIPWGLAFLPDKSLLITERTGQVLLKKSNETKSQEIGSIKNVKVYGEGGLLGIALHPDFGKSNHYVYLYYTYSSNGDNTLNKVIRMNYENGSLLDEKVIVDKIPGSIYHNGGRIKFGQDNYLYITTGDAQNPSQAQDKNSLSGKVLRVKENGDPAPGNPFGNRVYSYGHRNPQGIAWDSDGKLWETEHGRSGVLSGLDEINLIEPGNNYGWSLIQGNETKSGLITPLLNSGASTTWAPSGAAFYKQSLFFGGLKGESLYEYDTVSKKLKEHFKNQFGRIRDVVLGHDDMLYITTSNRDGRGNPAKDDDKVIRVNPKLLD